MRDYTIHQVIAILNREYPNSFSQADHELNTYILDKNYTSLSSGKRVYNEVYGHSKYCGTFREALKDLAAKKAKVLSSHGSGQ